MTVDDTATVEQLVTLVNILSTRIDSLTQAVSAHESSINTLKNDIGDNNEK